MMFFYGFILVFMMAGTILLPPLFIFLFDYYPEAIPLLVFISLSLIYLDFRWGKPWSEYDRED